MQVGGAPVEEVTPGSAARIERRHKCREYESMAASRTNMGHKPNQLDVKPRGYVDPMNGAKNA